MNQKTAPQTPREQREAYELATLRDLECVRCHRGDPQRHHRQGRDRLNTIPSNLILLCLHCHQWAHAHPAEARAHGFIVSSYIPIEEICEVPVLLYRQVDAKVLRRTWALLSDEGDVTWVGPRVAAECMEKYGVKATVA